MNVKNYKEDPEIEDRDWDETAGLEIREEDEANDLLNGISIFDDVDDQSDDYGDGGYDDDYEEEDEYELGLYFDEPPQSQRRWKKTRRKRSRQDSYPGQRFRWDDDGEDDW